MDHSRHTPINADALTAEIAVGAPIYGRDDSEISTVDHIHNVAGRVEVVFDVGGFLGIGSKRVSLRADQLDFMRDEDGVVHAVTQMTEDQLKSLPEHIDAPALN